MSQLTNNTTNLQAILDAVNALPEATAPKLQAKTATPSTSAQTVKPDSGYDGLSQVTVNAMTTATQATPTISVDSAGKITASATQTAGYVAAGTKSATKQLTTQAAKTVTPSTSSQTAVASGVYTTGAVTVAAIPSSYVKPSATQAATTYTPTTSNQTIAAGTYCSGAQTIKGDSNLVADNIKSGVSIFGVAGSFEGSGGSSGGETRSATGTFTVSSNVTSTKTTVATITGLGFKPHSIIVVRNDSKRSLNTTEYTYGMLYSDALNYGMCFSGKSTAFYVGTQNNNSNPPDWTVTTNDDGFVLEYRQSSMGALEATTYRYVAIG